MQDPHTIAPHQWLGYSVPPQQRGCLWLTQRQRVHQALTTQKSNRKTQQLMERGYDAALRFIFVHTELP